MTQIDTDEGPLYLAPVEDMFARRLLGFAMSEHHDTALTIASLQMAAATRGGDVDGVIFHSDRGSELGFKYTAARYQQVCRRLGVVQSMGRVGSPPTKARASQSRRKRPTAPTPSSAAPANASVSNSKPGGFSASSAAAPHRAGFLAKAIHVLQIREAHAS